MADGARYLRLGLFLLALLVAGAVLAFNSVLEDPSGEGVPGPAEWSRHELSQTGP